MGLPGQGLTSKPFLTSQVDTAPKKAIMII